MAACNRRLPPPPPPPPAPPSVVNHPGKDKGSWLLPEPESEEKPLNRLAPAIAPGDLANPRKESALCLPAPEKQGEAKENPSVRPAPANTPENLTNPVKKQRRPVPMTDEERNKIKNLKELHGSVFKELQELCEERDDLRKNYDELLFWRRFLAARLVNRIVFQRREAAYFRHRLDMGLKMGDKCPEELKKARQPISKALFMWRDMGRAMQLGMDKFIAEYSNPQEFRKRIKREWNAAAGLDENGVPLSSVDQK